MLENVGIVPPVLHEIIMKVGENTMYCYFVGT